jgi:hypothetical protein
VFCGILWIAEPSYGVEEVERDVLPGCVSLIRKDPEDDDERGMAELEERIALERQQAGKMLQGVKLKHEQ